MLDKSTVWGKANGLVNIYSYFKIKNEGTMNSNESNL